MMKTSLVVLMTCMMTCMVTQAELLNVLHAIHTSHSFQLLTPDEQVMLVELIAVAEACKLHAYESSIDMDALNAMIAHLPNAEEHQLEQYLQSHLHKESTGQCNPNQVRPTTQALRNN